MASGLQPCGSFPSSPLKCPEREEEEITRNAHHSSEQHDCPAAYCQSQGLLPVGTAEVGERLSMPAPESSFHRIPWSGSAKRLSPPPPNSEGLLPFKAATVLFLFTLPSFWNHQPQQLPQTKEGGTFFLCVMFHCILGSVVL